MGLAADGETDPACAESVSRNAHLADAARLLRDGDREGAAAAYEKVLEADPDNGRALAGLSRTWTARDDFERGLRLAEKALAVVPTDRVEAEARLARGEALFRGGRLDEAGMAFRRALRVDASLAPAWYGLARWALTVPRYHDAGLFLRQAAVIDPDDPRIIRRLAGLVASRDEVKALYRHYLELPPAEGEDAHTNARAWLAVLEAAGNRPLYRLEGPDTGESLPLARVQGRPLVDVRLGDLPARPFLIDSGGGGVTVSEDLVRRLDLRPLNAYTVRGLSADTAARPFVLLPRLAVGPYVLHDVPAVMVEGGGARQGIVGLSLLAPLTPVMNDFRDLRLARATAPHEGCPTGEWWRLRNVGGMLRLTARLQQQPVHLLVDTGAARSVLARAALRRLGLTESPGGGAGLSGITGTARDLGRVKERGSLSFLGRQTSVRGVAVLDLSDVSRTIGTEIDGILGVDLLRGRRLTFDYAAGRLRVESTRSARP